MDNPDEKVTGVLKDYIVGKNPRWAREEIKITCKLAEKTFEELRKAGNNTEIKVMEIYPEFKPVGSVIFPLSVTEGENTRKILLRARVEIMKNIAVAATGIKKGKLLEASDIIYEERDVALLPPKYFLEEASPVNKEAKITIPKNSTLFDWMVGDLPLIRQGAGIMIRVTSPGLMLRTRGVAMDDGQRAGEIKVKRQDSNKILTGKVLSPDEVEVSLK